MEKGNGRQAGERRRNIVVITAKDMRDYEAVSRRLFMEKPNIGRYKTSLVVRRIKVGTVIPLEADE